MNYFILERDQRLGAIEGILSCSASLKQGYESASQEEQVEISGEGVREYGCLLEHPVPLVSNELCEIFKKQYAGLQTKQVRIMDTVLRQILNYHLIQMPQINVEAQLRTPELESSKIAYGFIVPYGEVKEQAFFELNNVRKKMMVVNLTLAEHVLREGIYGVAVRRITIQERDS
jgi:hypothetical protein